MDVSISKSVPFSYPKKKSVELLNEVNVVIIYPL